MDTRRSDEYIVDILATTLWEEARGEYFRCVPLAYESVMTVIHNRAMRYGGSIDTYMRVCLTPFQFSCWNAWDPENGYPIISIHHHLPEWIQAKAIANDVVIDKTFQPVPILSGFYHYYNPKLCSPVWGKDCIKRISIGNHDFVIPKNGSAFPSPKWHLGPTGIVRL